MGRKKIPMKEIQDKKKRNITFNKRKIGLLKKAVQLAELCGTQIMLSFTDLSGNLIKFQTEYTDNLMFNQQKTFMLTPKDYPRFITRGQHQKGDEEQFEAEEDVIFSKYQIGQMNQFFQFTPK